ncbi:MAG: DNA polymerase III subunit delta', partial [Rickettsiella sp.]|nr:DNA polymerase III subunit delta' [Rickettsiella sp.]
MKSSELHSFVVPFVWQEKQWQHLYQLHQTGRLPHALLFIGQAGLGKHLFAAQFAKTLLCKPALQSGTACQNCRDCLLIAANTHPDFSCVVPDKVGKGIKIEQIRNIIQQSNQTSQSAYKIIMIDPADSLLVASSNALLKNLEEPSDRTLFILITSTPARLLPTIRSRCQTIRFTSPPRSQGENWVREQMPDFNAIDKLYALADEAPLQAIDYAKIGVFEVYESLLNSLIHLVKRELDPIKVAESYLKMECATILHCLVKIVSDIIKCSFVVQTAINPHETSVRLLAKELNISFLFNYFEQLIDYHRHAKIALN